nr:DNA helicase [Tanacetum cinerariifolium]
MCPEEGDVPRFLQLYIYDTNNEVQNRMAHFGGEEQSGLKREIVEGLIDFLDNHNALVQLFRTARNKHADINIPEFKLRLYNVIGTRRYDLPTPETIGAIIFGGKTAMESEFDLIVEEHSRVPQRVNKLHPCYMALQFPLLFVYGEEGYQKDMKLVNVPGQSMNKQIRVSMNMYYAYQIHDRVNHYNLLPRGGKLFQQYVVTAYCAVEQTRLDYIRQSQNDIRNEYLSGIYDAILRGDRNGSDLGTRTILSASFTGGPRYITMAEPSETLPKAANKGKLTLFQKEATTLKDIKPADINKTIEVCVHTTIKPIPDDSFPEHYFEFIAYNEVHDRANANDPRLTAEKFDMHEYAQMPKPVVIAVSSTWATTKYGALQINATPATYYYLNPNIPEVHHILNVKCTSCNKKVPKETSACSDHGLQPINYGYCFRILIDDGTAIATITCFSPEAHTFTPNCNDLVNNVQNKDNHSLPDALKALENTTHIFQYRFGQKAKPGRPNFSLDSVFSASPQPLLHRPPPESATSPPQELLEQTSSTIIPLPAELDPHQLTKDLPKGLDTRSLPKNKTAKRKLFEDTEESEKNQGKKTKAS